MVKFRMLVFGAVTVLLVWCATCSQLKNTLPKLIRQRKLAENEIIDFTDDTNIKPKFRTGRPTWRQLSPKTETFAFGQQQRDDYYIGIERKKFSFPSLENKSFTLKYSVRGDGTISYVHLVVKTDNGRSNAILTDGGIGQDNIVITLKTFETQIVKYTAFFYGYGNKWVNKFITCRNGTKLRNSSSSSCAGHSCSWARCYNGVCTSGSRTWNKSDIYD